MLKRPVKGFWVIVFLLLMVGVSACGQGDNASHDDKIFGLLDEIRSTEKQAILDHFNSLAKASSGISEDELMVSFFKTIRENHNGEISLHDSQILDSHFVRNYGPFYDVLFVSSDGFVFHSIKQEKDHHTNLFTGLLAKSSLALKLKSNPEIAFVDFESYGPSGESASFFVSQVFSGGQRMGWFILQYGSNELNAMLSRHRQLGRTGEIYLVNRDHMMLSDSRFINESSVLKLPVDTEPVRLAFEKGKGHSKARDYRGAEVYSSFETMVFLNVTWALLVEIDSAEVTNEYFLQNRSSLIGPIAAQAEAASRNLFSNNSQPLKMNPEERVDINEWKRVDSGGKCWTAGVGPCTALVAYLPGEFGYLLHLGPTDDVYIDDPLTKIFMGTRRTDLVTNLIERIGRFDVVENDLGQLKFTIVATHSNSFAGILDILLAQGISLSQIVFAMDTDVDYANVGFDQEKDEILVEWVKLLPEPRIIFLNTKNNPPISSFVYSK